MEWTHEQIDEAVQRYPTPIAFVLGESGFLAVFRNETHELTIQAEAGEKVQVKETPLEEVNDEQ